MATIRIAKRQRFTTIDRQTINDDRLSWRALGILTWLLDKPDNWAIDSTAMARIGGGREGRDAIRSAQQELRELGYLVTTRRRDDQGHWYTEQMLYETPYGASVGPLPMTKALVAPKTAFQASETQAVIGILTPNKKIKQPEPVGSGEGDLE